MQEAEASAVVCSRVDAIVTVATGMHGVLTILSVDETSHVVVPQSGDLAPVDEQLDLALSSSGAFRFLMTYLSIFLP